MKTLRALFSFAFALLLSVPGYGVDGKKLANQSAVSESKAPAPAVEFSPIDALIEDAIATKQIAGAVVLIGHDGGVVFRKGYGERALEPQHEAMTPETVFDIASLTKVVATTPSVMKLFQEGKIRLNDPISKYLPEFAKNDKQDVSIRQLMTHYSGLEEDLDLKQPWSGQTTAAQMVWDEKLISPPGASFRYSDINFITLGLMVERISGVSLDRYAEENIFKPLQMENTRFLPPPSWAPRIAPTEYDENQRMLRGVVHDPTARRMGGVAGHAGVFSTADDLAKYAQALLDGDHNPILTGATILKMSTPQQPPNATSLRGLGWDIDSAFSGNRGELLPVGSFGHTGFTGTSLWIDPFTHTYIILLTNAVHPKLGTFNVISLRGRLSNLVAGVLHLNLSDGDQQKIFTITGYNEAASGSRRPSWRNGSVMTGLDVLESTNFEALQDQDKDKRDQIRVGDSSLPLTQTAPRIRNIGLLTNQTGEDLMGRRTVDVLNSAPGIKLVALFSPEHGAVGQLDTTHIGDSKDPLTGVPIYSVYGDTDASRRPSASQLQGVDAIVFDIQDAGVRFYTYETTLGYFLEAAARRNIELIVLDRPNPISDTVVQGPISDPGKESFVNYHSLPVRHGMTLGELARFFNAERHIGAKLTVVPMRGYQPGDWYDSTGLLWTNPSPNLRDLTETTLYPGTALVEGANVSVGRGTDTPFEIVGAPWIRSRERDLAAYLNSRQIAGVRFVPTTFTPKSSNFEGELCGGINIIITDRVALDSPEMGIELASALRKLFPNDFKMEKMTGLLLNQSTFDALLRGDDPHRIADEWRDPLDEFQKLRERYLLYKH